MPTSYPKIVCKHWLYAAIFLMPWYTHLLVLVTKFSNSAQLENNEVVITKIVKQMKFLSGVELIDIYWSWYWQLCLQICGFQRGETGIIFVCKVNDVSNIINNIYTLNLIFLREKLRLNHSCKFKNKMYYL